MKIFRDLSRQESCRKGHSYLKTINFKMFGKEIIKYADIIEN